MGTELKALSVNINILSIESILVENIWFSVIIHLTNCYQLMLCNLNVRNQMQEDTLCIAESNTSIILLIAG